jgi:ABC-type branched-subunit amino acid transport system substrate-binding protein
MKQRSLSTQFFLEVFMRDELEREVSRSEFLRRTGALGIAGASVLGFPLLENRPAGAAPLAPPKDVIAAGGGATVKIGHIDGFSGVYAAASESQQTGLVLACSEANKKNSRVQFVVIKGDDNSQPAIGTNEAKRLISQEKVDVLTGCLSSAVGLAVSATAEENGVLFVAEGTHDTNITGPKANKVCFRATCSNAMLANAVGPALLKKGKKLYFITADYAFGNDGHDRHRCSRKGLRRPPFQRVQEARKLLARLRSPERAGDVRRRDPSQIQAP